MASYNKVMLMGNLVRDPELRVTPSGLAICRCTIACSRTVRSEKIEGGSREETTFVDVESFGKQAETVAKYFTKGQRIGVCGSLQTRSYEYEGQKRTATEIVVDEVEFVESGASKKEEEKPEQQKAEDLFKDELKDFKPLDDADLPF